MYELMLFDWQDVSGVVLPREFFNHKTRKSSMIHRIMEAWFN